MSDDADELLIKRLLGYDDHAEYVLDLTGLSAADARKSVERMLERARFRPPRSVLVKLDPAEPGKGETLFQPIGRQLLEKRRKGVLTKLAPLPAHAGSGYYLVTKGKAGRTVEEDT